MVAFRVRPRVARPFVERGASLTLAGLQATQGLCTLAAQGGDLQATGRQATSGSANLLALVGTQATRGLLTPDILCFGKQATSGQCALSGSVGQWPNGYTDRAVVEYAPQPDLSGTETNLVLRLTADVLTATKFKTTDNGGVMQSSAGWDIRLETGGNIVTGAGGTKLDHQLVAYSPTAGTIDLRFRVSSWNVATAFRLQLYVGKSGLGASEENPTGVWSGAMRANRLDTGADLGGGSRSLTLHAGVTAGATLAGMPAGTFTSAGYWRNSSPSYVPHLTAVTGEILFQLDSSPGATDQGNLERVGGTPLSAETHARYSSWIDSGGCINAGANWYDATSGRQNNESVQTSSRAVAAALVHSMAVRQSGQATVIYVNGASVPVTTINAPQTGYLNVLANDEDTVGAGQGFQNTALPGLYALDIQWPKACSAAFCAMRYRSEIECRSVAGMGSVDAFGDTDQGPVAVPLRTTNAGAQQDYDVVPGCYDPDSDPITLTAVGASTHAGDVTSLTGGKVRYKPQPLTYSGLAEVPFTVSDGRGKSSSSRLWLVVSPTVLASGYYKIPNHLTKAKTAHNVGSISALNTLQSNIGSDTSWAATNYINITADFLTNTTSGSPLIITVGGTRNNPLVITCTNGDQGNNWSGRPIIYNTPIVLRKPWTWCFGLRNQILPTANHQWRVTGSYPPTCYIFEAQNCFVTACRGNASQFFYHDQATANADGLTINYNWHEVASQAIGAHEATIGLLADWFYRGTQHGAATIQNLTLMYNTATDSADTLGQSHNLRFVIIGNGVEGLTVPTKGTEIGWNYVDASVSHMFEFKNIPDYCHHNHCTGRGSPTAGFNIRGPSADGPTSGTRPLFLANRITAQLNQCDGGYADYVSNWLVNSGGAVAGEWHLYAHATRSGKSISGADGCKLVDNRALFVIGANDFEPDAYTYENLGQRADVFFQRGNQTLDTQLILKDNANAFCRFSGDPGTMSGSHPNITESAIHYQSAVSGFTTEVPPILDATKTGPGVSGLTWPY